MTCPKDHVVFQEGSENEFLFRVKSGTFRVEKRREEKRVLLATLGSNAVFGEMSFLDGNRTTASVIADEEGAQLWKLEIAFVKRLFATDRDLFRSFYQYLATILAKRLKHQVRKEARNLCLFITNNVCFLKKKSVCTNHKTNANSRNTKRRENEIKQPSKYFKFTGSKGKFYT